MTTPSRINDVAVTLPLGWFTVPVQADSSLPWVAEAVQSAGRLAADSGLVETLPGWDASLADELHGVWTGLNASLDDGATAAVWIPSPGLGRVSALVVIQVCPMDEQRSPVAYAEVLMALAEAPLAGEKYLHAQTLEGTVPAGPVIGAHFLIGRAATSEGVGEIEERTAFGVFPADCTDMVEVLFVSEHVGAFEDMPDETLQLLAELKLNRQELT